MKQRLVSKLSRQGVRQRRAGLVAAIIAMAVVLQCSALLVIPFVHVDAAQSTVRGVLTAVYGDPASGTTMLGQEVRYFVSDANTQTEISLDENVARASGGIDALIGREVVVTVNVPVGPLVATTAPRTVAAIALAPGAAPRLQPRTVTGSQPFVNILCKFNDIATEPEAPTYFDGLMAGGTNTIGSYWREVSYNQIDVDGSVSAGWYTLPFGRTHYITGVASTGNTFDLLSMAQDCTAAASGSVNFTSFRGINMMFNYDASSSWGGSEFLSLSGSSRVWPMTWLMPWAYHIEPGYTSGPTPMAHEMGHAFGLRHSGDPTGTTYHNSWDVMSEGYLYCPRPLPTPYGCTGQHLIAYDKDFLGWIPVGRRFAWAGVTRKITLGQLAGGTVSDSLIAVIPHGATTFTTVEMRHRQTGTFDTKLPGDAVILHEVDTTRTSNSTNGPLANPAWVVGTNGNTGAEFLTGSTYTVPGTSPAVVITVQSLGTVNAVVVISNGQTPTVTGTDSVTGSGTGGALVTLTGTNFSPEATVTFGGTPAPSVVLNGNGTLGVTTPALAAGSYTVTVTNPDGRSATLTPLFVVSAVPAVQPGGGHPLVMQPGVVTPQPLVHPTLAPIVPPVATPLPQPVRH